MIDRYKERESERESESESEGVTNIHTQHQLTVIPDPLVGDCFLVGLYNKP